MIKLKKKKLLDLINNMNMNEKKKKKEYIYKYILNI